MINPRARLDGPYEPTNTSLQVVIDHYQTSVITSPSTGESIGSPSTKVAVEHRLRTRGFLPPVSRVRRRRIRFCTGSTICRKPNRHSHNAGFAAGPNRRPSDAALYDQHRLNSGSPTLPLSRHPKGRRQCMLLVCLVPFDTVYPRVEPTVRSGLNMKVRQGSRWRRSVPAITGRQTARRSSPCPTSPASDG